MLHLEKTSYHWKAALQPQTFMGNLSVINLCEVFELHVKGEEGGLKLMNMTKTYMWGHPCLTLIGKTIPFS